MLRSPPANRTRGKLANKEKAHSSLSLTSDPTDKKPTDKKMVDSKLIEDCVNKYLLKDNVFDVLITRLSEHIKVAVEEALNDSLKVYSEELNRLRGEVSTLKKQVTVLDNKLRCKTDDIEQYQRRNNLRVFGVRETNGEDTDRLVVDLVKNKLGVDLRVEAIERSHRVGAKQRPREDGTQQHRPIIVRFCSYRDRRRVYDEKKKLKGSGFIIKEDLTAGRLEVLRTAVDRFGVRNTWTADGKVFWVANGEKRSATRLADIPATKPDGDN